MDLQPPPFNISQLIELQYAPDTCYCAFNMPYVTANINLLLHLHLQNCTQVADYKTTNLHNSSTGSTFRYVFIKSGRFYGPTLPRCCGPPSSPRLLLSIWRSIINVTNTAAKRLICNNLLLALLSG
jgi:hypothetical protein